MSACRPQGLPTRPVICKEVIGCKICSRRWKEGLIPGSKYEALCEVVNVYNPGQE
ncbi:hypothetical protein THOM_2859 [Trachipleistophora hominis]|uniref:Uncharacterized protein n=1 Tax=Trachipleistophora hominis TaxID=72359 RepID=L7JRX3_TRAHO|nr:hypothetical protein THOM_2859 [Trachipleistophora hominis]